MGRRSAILLLVLLALSIVAAGELFYIDYQVNFGAGGFKSFCNINQSFNCDAVAASPYSSFKGIPLAFWGMMLNLFLFGLVLDRKRLGSLQTYLLPFLLAVVSFQVLFCFYLAYVSSFILQTFCLVCMIFWLVTAALFVTVLVLNIKTWHNLPRPLWPNLKSALGQEGKVPLIYAGIILLVTAAGSGYFLYQQACLKGGKNLACQYFDEQHQVASFGAQNPDLEIVMYTDFQCGWCRQAHYELQALVHKYVDRVRFVRKDFPLDQACNPAIRGDFHHWACMAAKYARCAGEQGKYWAFHDALYEHQDELGPHFFTQTAQRLGLRLAELEVCLADPRTKVALNTDIEDGLKYGVEGTPSFRIFTELVLGRITEENILEYLADYPWLNSSTVQRLIDQGGSKLQILDLSSPEDFAHGHLPGAINFKLDSVKAIDLAAPTIIYDQDGQSVFLAWQELKQQGLRQAFILKGGFQGWPQDVAGPGAGSR